LYGRIYIAAVMAGIRMKGLKILDFCKLQEVRYYLFYRLLII
jgi:hypothetical protein